MVVNVANQISKKRSTTKLFSSRRFFILGGALAAVVLTLQNLSYVVTYLTVEDWKESGPSQSSSIWEYLASPTTVKISSVDEPSKTVIAYAVSVTNCPDDNRVNIMDGAAVLHQSIRLASRSSKYDYHMLAFIHPGAQSCIPFMKRLGYEIQIRDTPFNDTDIKNPELALAQENSCCGTKEYLKLYSYLQTEFPVVVHLDLDCLVLKPLDDIFDLMLDPTFNRTRIPIMHLKPEEIPEQVDFVFTRDYGMVEVSLK